MTARRGRHRAEDLVLRTTRALIGVLPEDAALYLGAALGVVVGSVLRLRRADVDRHLSWAFSDSSPAWRRRVARASYAHFGREAVVLFRRGGWTREGVLSRTTVVGFEGFLEAVAAGDGLVLLTGHLGNWEIGGAALAARGVPLDVVGKGMSNDSFQKDLFAARERLGMRIIEMGDAAREGIRSLRRGRVVALLGDQRARRGHILVPFFGKLASTTRGPALLAVRTGAPVWVAFAIRDRGRPHRYNVTFEPLPFVSTGDLTKDVAMLMEAYGRRLEEAVKATPEQYFWHHRRWKEPLGEEPGRQG